MEVLVQHQAPPPSSPWLATHTHTHPFFFFTTSSKTHTRNKHNNSNTKAKLLFENRYLKMMNNNSSSTTTTTTITTTASQLHEAKEQEDQKAKTSKGYLVLLIINYICLFVGSVSASLLSKYYFNHKGSSKWVSTWVQCAGFPLLLFPIFLPYYLFKCTDRRPFSHFTTKIFILSIFVGIMLALNNLLFSWGNSYLPVSTSSLLLSSQLVFNLIFSVILVKQKITFSNLNCVVLLTLSSVLLALGSNHDKSPDLPKSKYFIGFFCTIGAGLLFALYLPIMQMIYNKVYCYSMVVEMQLIMEIAATALATVGMALDGGYSEMRREGLRVFDKGPKIYWVTVFGNVVTWQLCFMGTAGLVFLTSSLTGGICMTAILAMNVLGGVVVYGESFPGIKAVSTVLCAWGFCSYVYGLYVKVKQEKDKEEQEKEMNNNNNINNQGMEMVQIVTAAADRV